MSTLSGIPQQAVVAINDLLEHGAATKPGQEVLLLAHIDGLHGGDNMVDEEAISWIETMVRFKGAKASVLWIDEPAKAHAWRFPPIVKGAMLASDLMINHSFDIVFEENMEFRDFVNEHMIPMVRNFATTAPLLCTAWARTPHELVSEIRYQSSLPIKVGLPWELKDDNGTRLEGTILPSNHFSHVGFPSYSGTRRETGYYWPWPEWVHPPIIVDKTSGTLVFDAMLSWWSRYIGISPFFTKPIRLTINDCRIVKIEGGDEADALRSFLSSMEKKLGQGVYDFNALHFGVHPQAAVAPHQCPNILYRRLIEHCHSSNIHVHVGAPAPNANYPYWMHLTGDIRSATFRVGDTLVHDRGHLMALDSPAVKAIAARYPGRPGLDPEPRSF